jgi:D-beta-D-heptose 7-phosphate kinase/D-beta-D-heptose 1-phosphate adenosyltransferase
MKRIVVNGTFDVLHIAHIKMLNYAGSIGDHLLVCIDTDRRVRELKGNSRPINNEHDRRDMLLNIKAVDQVELFDSNEELIEIFKAYEPDVMVKGSDYKDKPIVGKSYCKQIEFFERIDEYSTSNTIQRIIDRR